MSETKKEIKTRFDIMFKLLYPHTDSGKSLGYESSQNGVTVTNWSPHNVRRLFISPYCVAVQYYKSTSKKPFKPMKSTMRIREEVLHNELQQIQNGEKVNGVLKILTAYKQFSNIEEIIFCDYGQYQQLLTYDLNKAVIEQLGGKGGGDFAEKLKNKFRRLYQIGYSSLDLKNVINLATNEAKALNKTVAQFDKGYKYAYKCKDDSCFTSGGYFNSKDYAVDTIISELVNGGIERYKAEKEEQQKAEAEKNRPKSIDKDTISALYNKYGQSVSYIVKLLSVVEQLKSKSQLYSDLVKADNFVYDDFDLKGYILDVLSRAKGSEQSKAVFNKVVSGGKGLPSFDIETVFTKNLTYTVFYLNFNFDFGKDEIDSACQILVMFYEFLLASYINAIYIYYDNSEPVLANNTIKFCIDKLLSSIDCTKEYGTAKISTIQDTLADLIEKAKALSKPKKETREDKVADYDWSKFNTILPYINSIADFEKLLTSFGKKKYMIEGNESSGIKSLQNDLVSIIKDRLGVLACKTADLSDHDDIENLIEIFKYTEPCKDTADIDSFVLQLKYVYISYCAFIVSMHIMKSGSILRNSKIATLKQYNLTYDDRIAEVINGKYKSCSSYLSQVATKVTVDIFEQSIDTYVEQYATVLKEMKC